VKPSKSLQEMIDENIAALLMKEQFDKDCLALVTLLDRYEGPQVSALALGKHCTPETIEFLSHESVKRNKGSFYYHGLAIFDVSTLRSILSS